MGGKGGRGGRSGGVKERRKARPGRNAHPRLSRRRDFHRGVRDVVTVGLSYGSHQHQNESMQHGDCFLGT